MRIKRCISRCMFSLVIAFLICMTAVLPSFAASTYDSGSDAITKDDYTLNYSWVTTYDKADSSQSGDNNGGSGSVSLNGAEFKVAAKSSYYKPQNLNPFAGSKYNMVQDIVYNYTTRLTLTNDGSYGCTINYTTSGSLGVVTNKEVTLAVGESIVFTLATTTATTSTTAQDLSGTVTINSIKVHNTMAIGFASWKTGGYSYTVNENNTVTMAAGTEPVSEDLEAGAAIELTAGTPAEGYSFYGWMADGMLLSTAATYTYTPSIETTIYPVFLSDDVMDEGNPFTVGSNTHKFWQLAVADAVATGNVIVLNRDYTMPVTLEENGLIGNHSYVSQTDSAVTYTIPSDVTFLIPYDSTYDTSTSKYVHSGSSASGAYATLTVPSTITLKVNQGGTLIVNAQVVGNGSPLEGVAVGTYGKMIVGGTIDVYGSVYARGYIVDANHTTSLGTTDASGNLVRKGRFYARSGSDIHVLLQIDDYRGGNASNKIYESVFPTSDFYFCNIMIRAEYSAGATMQARYMVSTNEKTNYTTVTNEIPVLGSTSESFLQQSGGTITMDYEYSTDKMVIEGKNTQITINDITIKFTYLFVEKVMSTSDKEIPICRNLQIIIGEGASLACSKNLKMIPGSSIQLKDGGTMNITGSVYLYDANDYNTNWMYGSAGCAYRRLPVTGLIKSAGSSVAETSDATITVGDDCTLTVGGNLLQSKNHSGGIIGHDGATLVINNVATSGSVNETANADGSVTANEDWACLTGLLAGLSDSATNYQPFSDPGAGTYYATGKWASTTNAAWYQYVISVADGVSGVTAVNGNKSVGETNGYVSVTHGTGDTAVTTSNVVGYSVNGGEFSFTTIPYVDVAVSGSTAVAALDETTADNLWDYTLTGIDANTTLTLTDWVKYVAISLDAEAEVVLNLKFNISDSLLNSEDAYVEVIEEVNEVTKDDADTDPSVLIDTYTMADLANLKDAEGRYELKRGIAAGEMTGDVTVKFYDGKGNQVNIRVYTDNSLVTDLVRTVVDYSRLSLADGSDAMKNLSSAMLTYGRYAQQYFGVDTANLADSIIIATEFANATFTKYNVADVTADTIEQKLSTSGSDIGITYDTQKIGLDSRMYMVTYFTLDEGKTINDYKFTVTPDGGTKYVVTAEMQGSRVRVKIDNIPVAYWDRMYTINVSDGTNAYSVTGSVLAWADRCIEGSENEAQVNMAKAMYYYNQTANVFFDK